MDKLIKMNYICAYIIYFVCTLIFFGTCSNLGEYSEAVFYNKIPNLSKRMTNNYEISHYTTISENCTEAAEAFTEDATNLTRCMSLNSRPIRLCVNCEKEINLVINSYSKLQKVSPECQQLYFASDQLGITTLIYNMGKNIWTKSNCQNCYDHMDETKKFISISDELNKCIQDWNQPLPGRNGTCDLCHDLFVELNDIYNAFVKNISHEDVTGVCMDIVDQINITRRVWNEHKCVKFDASIGYPNIITAVLVSVMPVFFYLLSKNISIIEDVKLVRPKRKGFSSSMPST